MGPRADVRVFVDKIKSPVLTGIQTEDHPASIPVGILTTLSQTLFWLQEILINVMGLKPREQPTTFIILQYNMN
jgi:hypothetical protein